MDVLGGDAPFMWRSNDIEFQLGFFNGETLFDLSAFDSVKLEVVKQANRLGARLMTKTTSSLNTGLTLDQWKAGTAQHCVLRFTNQETDIVPEDLDESYWMVISGLTADSPPIRRTFNAALLRNMEDGTPYPDLLPTQGGNIVPLNATYDGGGAYTLAVDVDRIYRWAKGANDTNVVNGGETITTSNAMFVTEGATIVLHGTANAVITAIIRPDVILTSDEMDARYRDGSLKWRGAYIGGTQYYTGDVVYYGGSSWRAKRDNINVTPVAGDDWAFVAQAGAAGASAYLYVAWADASDGTGFTLTFDAAKNWIATKPTTVAIVNPVQADFTGLWKYYKGQTGAAGAGYGGTSTTNLLIGLGTKAFTTQSNMAYTAGARVRASSAANTSNWMEGVVADYAGVTLTVLVDLISGSGTFNDWNLNAAGNAGLNSFLYLAYADDNVGTGFTTTFNAGKKWIAALHTTVAIASPVAGDFAGLWAKYIGSDGKGYGGTSTTSHVVGLGSLTWTVLPTDTLAYVVGTRVRLASSGAPTTNWCEGVITAYTPNNGNMTVLVDKQAGAGATVNSWTVSVSGQSGTDGVDGSAGPQGKQGLAGQGFPLLSALAGETLAPLDLIYQDVTDAQGSGRDKWWKVDTNAAPPLISSRIGLARTVAEPDGSWTERQGGDPATYNWSALKVSSDGQRIIATSYIPIGDGGGRIYKSADGGGTWTAVGLSLDWVGVTMSANGRYGYTITYDQGVGASQFYRSSDYGGTWQKVVAVSDAHYHYDVACSSDGKFVLLAGTDGSVYRSTDFGATFSYIYGAGVPLRAITVSDDGLITAICGETAASQIIVSVDGCQSWTGRGPSTQWSSLCASADGSVMYATSQEVGVNELVWVSTDSGTTWNDTGHDSITSPVNKAIACSADGQVVIANDTVSPYASVSIDGGATWTDQTWPANTPPSMVVGFNDQNNRFSVGVSGDGKRFVSGWQHTGGDVDQFIVTKDNGTFLAQIEPGLVPDFSGLTTGKRQYASGTPGALTETVPAGLRRAVGYAVDATTLYFEPKKDVDTAQNATPDSGKFLNELMQFAAPAGAGDMLAANNLSDVANAATAFANIKQAVSNAASGVAPMLPNDATKFLSGVGTWVTPAGGGDMVGANNLSDVANVATSRTNLGLGTAAVKDAGSAGQAGKVLNADDATTTNSRTPTAHATSHKSGGGDAIKLDELAAPTDVTALNVTSSQHGLAPKAPANASKFLNGAATPVYDFVKDSDLTTTDITTNNVTTAKHGFTPKLPNDATKFLNGVGGYTVPPGQQGTVNWTDDNGTYSGKEWTRFTPSSGSANVAAVISPKGTGAFQLSVADGTATGGNNRGPNSVDVQTLRYNSDQVASGVESTLAGVGNKASGERCVAIGWSNKATGVAGVAVGISNNVTQTAYAFGRENTASGWRSGVFGEASTASNTFSYAFGFGVVADKVGQVAFGSGGIFAHVGDSQFSFFKPFRETTDATPTELFLESVANADRMTLSNNSAWAFRILVVARRTDATGGSAAYEFTGLIVRDANAASTAIVGTVVKTVVAETDAAWDCDVDADTTNGALRIKATGQNGKTIRWVARVETTEVKN